MPAITDAPSPSSQGLRGRAPKGIVFHPTRSGVAANDTHREFRGTVAFAAGGAGGLAWHVTVGDDEIAIHLDPEEWGWHARDWSREWLGIEFAQATMDRPIGDGQVRAAVWWIRHVVMDTYPGFDPSCFVFHSEIPPGIADGKSDPFPNRSPQLDDLRWRILGSL